MTLRARCSRRRGYAMLMSLMIMVTMAITSTAVLTAAFNELRSSKRSLERTQGRIYAAVGAEEVFSRIASQRGFLDPVFDTDPATWPAHPAIGSQGTVLKWARLDQPAMPCDPVDYTSDCYHVDIRRIGTTSGAQVAAQVGVEVTVRHSCDGAPTGCTYQRYEQRIRQRQFFDFLYFHQFSTRDPQDYLTDGTVTRAWALANCADRYALRSNGLLGPRPSDCTSIAFQGEGSTAATQDLVSGPIYTADDYITVCGNPNFAGAVLVGGAGLTVSGTTRVWSLPPPVPPASTSVCSASPTISASYPNSGVLSMPSSATTFAQAKTAANLNITATSTTPVTVRFSSLLAGSAYVTQVQVTGSTTDGTFTLPDPGVLAVDGSVDVAGTVAGRVSLFARNDLTISGNLVYRGGGTSTNTTDVLGLTAGGAMTIQKSAAGRTIHALMLSLTGSIRTENWRIPDSPFNTSWVAPTLTMFGAMASKYQGMFGGFDVATAKLVSGYRKAFSFDARPSTNPGLMPPLLISPINADWERLSVTELPGAPGAATASGTAATVALGAGVVTAPLAPTSVSGTPGYYGFVDLTWTRGADGGSPVTSQSVAVYRNGTKFATFTVSATAAAYRVTGLSNAYTYTFTVSATNAYGTSQESLPTGAIRPY